MKKILFAFAAMITLTFGRACSRSAKLKHVWLCSCLPAALSACGNKQAVAPAGGDEASNEVAFEVAKNYFFKNDQEIPSSPKITTAEEFGKLFGMATTMGNDGKPTEIDFTRQFVLAIVLPVTNLATEITPDRLEEKGDTLKCVSGGNHPGLMHICQMGEYFYVPAFEQVEDGSRFLPSAKRIFGEYFETFQIHHSNGDEHESLRHDVLRAFVRDHGLTATMYQDYGWPAKELNLSK